MFHEDATPERSQVRKLASKTAS
ncbi:hypothetical protein [Paraburkholderia tropica]